MSLADRYSELDPYAAKELLCDACHHNKPVAYNRDEDNFYVYCQECLDKGIGNPKG